MTASNESNSPKTLAINPAFHHSGGAGIAIVDVETASLQACGFLLASDHAGLADNGRQFWNRHVGNHVEPQTLYIAYHQQVLTKNGDRVHHKATTMNGMLCACIEYRFSPNIIVKSKSCDWNDRQTHLDGKQIILQYLDILSQTVLSKALAEIPIRFHDSIYDAVAMGIWEIDKTKVDDKPISMTTPISIMRAEQLRYNVVHYNNVISNTIQPNSVA